MTGPFTIRTSRLELIAGNHAMAVAEMTNIINLSALLNAGFDYGWPPPENDEQTMEWFFRKIYDNPQDRGWLIWYFIYTANGKRQVVGSGGFTGAPGKNGIVECGYSILVPMQKSGFATEAVDGLVNWAFTCPDVKKVVARTMPDNKASIKVLEKNKFKLAGNESESGTIVYERERKQPQA